MAATQPTAASMTRAALGWGPSEITLSRGARRSCLSRATRSHNQEQAPTSTSTAIQLSGRAMRRTLLVISRLFSFSAITENCSNERSSLHAQRLECRIRRVGVESRLEFGEQLAW